MDVSNILDSLNDAQRDAVGAPPGHLLVLAGAGSGKTRVLVHRMAWLIAVEGASPYSILAVTFTNKAAAEMRGRIEQMLNISAGGLWVGTFHGLAHRLLRAHWREAGLPQAFQILDSDDQYRLVRRLLKALELDEARWPPKQAQWFINGRKDEGLRPHHIRDNGDPYTRQMVRIYQAYEETCQRGGMVDFAELLLRCLEVLQKHPEVLAHYRQRFRHILVDEFQDTNAIQYAWIKLLAGNAARLFIVGDDDQSIYGWRGARIENIQRVSQDFPGTRVIRLEQNYRSTGTILAAANALIANNEGRLGKNLWTAGEQGEPIQFYTAFNDLDEARFIVERIRQWVEHGHARREAAILYRSNAQSRVLEEALLHAAIPYRIYGGLRFFERAEIKDALGYLRLIANRDDDAAFERVVNTPTRGIGERGLGLVRDHARQHGVSLWRAAHEVAVRPVAAFLALIEKLARDTAELTLGAQAGHVITHSGLRAHYGKEKGEKGEARLENLDELANAARQFEHEHSQRSGEEAMEPLSLSAFLAHAALEAGEGQGDAWDDCAQLMTLHSAKGLEFPLVFMCGMEEGLFPHQMSAQEPGRLEEERRLCYVGITRARRHLVMTCAERRRLHGSEVYPKPSRFIGEIPGDLLREVRPRASITRPLYGRTAPAIPVSAPDDGILRPRLGSRVMHGRFGEGVILNYEGQGDHARVQVNFKEAGSKWLVMAYANLQAV